MISYSGHLVGSGEIQDQFCHAGHLKGKKDLSLIYRFKTYTRVITLRGFATQSGLLFWILPHWPITTVSVVLLLMPAPSPLAEEHYMVFCLSIIQLWDSSGQCVNTP